MDPDIQQWAEFPGHPDYHVSTDGSVKGKRGQLLSLQKRVGDYVQVNLAKDRKNVMGSVHRAVATAFIQNPSNLPAVNHINGNKHDNSVKNLEWVSHQENCQKRKPRELGVVGREVVQLSIGGVYIATWPSLRAAADSNQLKVACIGKCCRGDQKTSQGFRWMFLIDYMPPTEDEEWKDIEHVKGIAAVSSKGRFRTKTGRITKGSPGGNGYYSVGTHGHYRAHRIVAEAFCQKNDGCEIVNHINGDRSDNGAVNLEWTTPQGNRQHALDTGLVRLRRVRRLFLDGSSVEYKSATEASTLTGFSLAHVCRVCGAEGSTGDRSKWSYIEEPEDDEKFSLDDVYPDRVLNPSEASDPDLEELVELLLASV